MGLVVLWVVRDLWSRWSETGLAWWKYRLGRPLKFTVYMCVYDKLNRDEQVDNLTSVYIRKQFIL